MDEIWHEGQVMQLRKESPYSKPEYFVISPDNGKSLMRISGIGFPTMEFDVADKLAEMYNQTLSIGTAMLAASQAISAGEVEFARDLLSDGLSLVYNILERDTLEMEGEE